MDVTTVGIKATRTYIAQNDDQIHMYGNLIIQRVEIERNEIVQAVITATRQNGRGKVRVKFTKRETAHLISQLLIAATAMEHGLAVPYTVDNCEKEKK